MEYLLNIVEEYGYQHWWLLCTQAEFDEICRRWQTMKRLNCLVPVDLIFPGARGQFGEWPPEALCTTRAADARVVRAHVHESDDSFLETVNYTIPPATDENDDSFELDGVVYTREQIKKLLDESRERRSADYYALHPEHAPQ